MLIDNNHGIYRGENSGPGKDDRGELDHRPGIREQPGSFASFEASSSDVGGRGRYRDYCQSAF